LADAPLDERQELGHAPTRSPPGSEGAGRTTGQATVNYG